MKILIAGDFSPRYRVVSLIERDQFNDILGEIKPIVEQTDFSLINLECSIINNAANPIPKCGPHLSSSSKCLDLISYAEFKAVTLANNHFYDFGLNGVKDSIKELERRDIKYVGAGMNYEEASQILYFEHMHGKVAFINCCEHEFSIADKNKGGCNPLNPIDQWYSIQEARSNADYVIVIVHGGHEHYKLPSPRMQSLYRFFIDAGADAVVNHHQHCYSGYEIYKNKPIVYGVGNFCFDEKGYVNRDWNEGYLVLLCISDGVVELKTIPYTQCNEKPSVCLLQDRTSFDSDIENINRIIANDELLRMKHEEWMNLNSCNHKAAFEPYSNKYLLKAYRKGLLPSLLKKKKILRYINYIECESHRDRVIQMLYNLIN